MLFTRALLAFALFLVSACRGPSSRDEATGAPRVISLHDVTTEIVVALGAADRLVGIAELYDASEELRAATVRVPRVEGLETLLAVKPDLVLGLEIVKSKSPDLVLALEQRGKGVFLPRLASVGDVEAMVHEVARRLHLEKDGDKLVAEFEARVGVPSPPSRPRKRVFVYDCCDPPFTAGKRTVLSDLIERVGGHNVFGDVDAAFTHVSWEEALQRKPELVVVHAYADGSSADVAPKIAALKAMPALRDVPVTVMPLRYSLGGLHTGDAAKLLRSALEGGGPT